MSDRDLPTRWMSVDECAQSIGVSAWWVRQRIEAGVLPALAISAGGRKILRVDRRVWTQFCAAHTGPATDPQFEGGRKP